MNEIHEGNRDCWNGWAKWWHQRREKVGVWKGCHREPQLVLSPGELDSIPMLLAPQCWRQLTPGGGTKYEITKIPIRV